MDCFMRKKIQYYTNILKEVQSKKMILSFSSIVPDAWKGEACIDETTPAFEAW